MTSLDERIAAAGENLAPSERDVARFFAEHRDEAAFLSAADIASALSVSNATVVRTAQTLGYSGLPELKRELRESLRTRAPSVERLARRLDALDAESDALVDHMLDAQISLLEEARRSLTSRDVRLALSILGDAKRVMVYAVGPYASLAKYFVLSLRRFGRDARLMSERGAGAADEFFQLQKGDALLVVHFERLIDEVDGLLTEAKRLGVRSVLVTDALALALRGRVGVALTAKRGSAGLFPLAAVSVSVLELLLFGLVGRDRARSVAAFEELNALRARMEGS